jgi:hypothetical protein
MQEEKGRSSQGEEKVLETTEACSFDSPCNEKSQWRGGGSEKEKKMILVFYVSQFLYVLGNNIFYNFHQFCCLVLIFKHQKELVVHCTYLLDLSSDMLNMHLAGVDIAKRNRARMFPFFSMPSLMPED